MTAGIELVGDLGYLLLTCAAIGTLAYVLRQPLILGFLVAGILIGPFGPFNLIKNVTTLNNFSDVAIVLLLFGVGLSFPLSKFRSVGKVGIGIALIEVLLMLGVGFLIGFVFGWKFYDSMFLAAALSISSTAIIVKVLEDMGKMDSTSGLLLTGILVIEDLVAIIMISTMHATVIGGAFDFTNTLLIIGKIGVFFAGTLGLGILVIPKIFGFISNFERFELSIIFALGFAFGLSFLTHELGFSAATGAFLAGTIIGNSRFSEQVSILISPTREIFTAIFFVTIGALMDLSKLYLYLIPVVVITIGVVLGKILGVYGGLRLFGAGKQYSLGVGMAMAQLGEFSFVVLKTGQDLYVISDFLFPIIGIVVAVTTFIGMVLVKSGMKMVEAYD